MKRTLIVMVSLVAALGMKLAADPPKFREPYDSEKNPAKPMAPDAAAKSFKVPPGFTVEVFASEPDVRNPIAMCWDAKGRIWVAENYTYAETQKKFDLTLTDRVIIFHDRDGDGKPDERKVFIDTVQRLTSVEVGLGGVWLMCPPQLLFVPDGNGDDVPDGPPVVILDGFDVPAENYHNFANGLRWGPDGWLYGRCGASAPGEVRRPDEGPERTVPLRGGIWCYHPQRKIFEALCHGTTNPWGHDWDSRGNCFFINTVGGHLWHMIPGAHFSRSHTIDPNPLIYQPMEMIADHWHFDTRKGWNQKAVNDSRNVDATIDALGGGHSHIGCMIYQGEQWPVEFRGRLFTLNQHGRRLNVEKLERLGSSYVGKREPDICFAGDPFFRGLEVSQGPDGSVFLLDWSDTGECHEHNGVHRNSGRIYRVRYGTSPAVATPDLTIWPGRKLAAIHMSGNGWLVRMARREIADRIHRGKPLSHAIEDLETIDDGVHYPQSLWARQTLFTVGRINSEKLLKEYLADLDPHHAVWAIRSISDQWPLDTVMSVPRADQVVVDDAILKHFHRLAGETTTPSSVRLALASTLQRLPVKARPTLAAALVSHDTDASDAQIPLMVWYGLIPVMMREPEAMIALAADSKIPLLRRWTARRFTEVLAEKPVLLEELLVKTATKDERVRRDVVLGMLQGLAGVRKATPPAAWKDFPRMTSDAKCIEAVRSIDIVFGDGRALDDVKRLAFDDKADLETRKVALRSIIEAGPPDLRDICSKLINVRFMNSIAIRGLAKFDDAGPMIAGAYRSFHPSERTVVYDVLSSRPAFAAVLLDRVANGSLARNDLSAAQARTIRGFEKPELTAKLAIVWGEFRDSPKEKQDLIAKLKGDLTAEVLAKADRSAGREVFAKSCASCHKLFGQGEGIGPDLTGAGRKDMDYLLGNIIDPSAVVTKDFQMTCFEMKDGRTLNGILAASTPKTLTIQLEKEKVTVAREDIERQKPSKLSLMPDALLQSLSPREIRDLFAYLQGDTQVGLPFGGK